MRKKGRENYKEEQENKRSGGCNNKQQTTNQQKPNKQTNNQQTTKKQPTNKKKNNQPTKNKQTNKQTNNNTTAFHTFASTEVSKGATTSCPARAIMNSVAIPSRQVKTNLFQSFDFYFF